MKLRLAATVAAAIALSGTVSASAEAKPLDRTRCQSATNFNHQICVDFEGDMYDADVVKMEVRASGWTGTGHWELFGPHGTVSNSNDGEWQNRSHWWTGYQDGAHGDLWCAVFWKPSLNGGYVRGTQPVCVTSGGV